MAHKIHAVDRYVERFTPAGKNFTAQDWTYYKGLMIKEARKAPILSRRGKEVKRIFLDAVFVFRGNTLVTVEKFN